MMFPLPCVCEVHSKWPKAIFLPLTAPFLRCRPHLHHCNTQGITMEGASTSLINGLKVYYYNVHVTVRMQSPSGRRHGGRCAQQCSTVCISRVALGASGPGRQGSGCGVSLVSRREWAMVSRVIGLSPHTSLMVC